MRRRSVNVASLFYYLLIQREERQAQKDEAVEAQRLQKEEDRIVREEKKVMKQ
jgi:hypothetical protein